MYQAVLTVKPDDLRHRPARRPPQRTDREAEPGGDDLIAGHGGKVIRFPGGFKIYLSQRATAGGALMVSVVEIF
jgi:hypothetical protein